MWVEFCPRGWFVCGIISNRRDLWFSFDIWGLGWIYSLQNPSHSTFLFLATITITCRTTLIFSLLLEILLVLDVIRSAATSAVKFCSLSISFINLSSFLKNAISADCLVNFFNALVFFLLLGVFPYSWSLFLQPWTAFLWLAMDFIPLSVHCNALSSNFSSTFNLAYWHRQL